MLASLLTPRSIAVVGVSVEPHKVGHQVFVNLSSFTGKVYPINPKHKKILGHTCYDSVLSLPDAVDLVVIVTPMQTVEPIVDECIDKKVGALIIITAGFAETSENGKLIQARIAQKCATHDIELLGPNTLGAVNPYAKMNASFSAGGIEEGSIGLISQSGAMLTTIFAEFQSRGVGCSFALSLGNKAGVSENEALEYALNDEHTKLIAVYLESLANPREFFAFTKKVSQKKPIIVLKGGTTSAGQTASLSHTAALATDIALLQAASAQMGFVVVETIEQFFETTFFVDQLLSPHARGGDVKHSMTEGVGDGKHHEKTSSTAISLPSNLMILTNAGGPGVNSVDLASMYSIPLATWSSSSIERFSREIPRVKPANPTDLLGDAQVVDIQAALEIAQLDKGIESLLLIITPQAVTDIPGITKLLIEKYGSHHERSTRKPIIASLMGGEMEHKYVQELRDHHITVSEYANEGIEIFGWVNHMRRAQEIDRSAVLMKQLEKALQGNTQSKIQERCHFPLQTGELEEVYILLENYGFTLPRAAIAKSMSDIDTMGQFPPDDVFPLIAKTANMKLKHKALVGGIVKDIFSIVQARSAYKQLTKFGNRVLFQEVIENGVEAIIGGKRDAQFGPFIAVGMGGSLTNVLSDRQYIFLPASQREIRAACARTKLFTQLQPQQKEQTILAVERFARLFNEHPEIEELEINPLLLVADKAYVADVKVTLFPKIDSPLSS
ncbi:hypothetical protein C5B42_00370 [Candidatus Cerribacteria bacterium 'Amazon FNV 2010 28 9']|uniref:CoA-binding domain-containing protein n=1 Tax=Candidatus Cerribacteria bacterium 'Amazon FNV 2010 28 9' TaxID=2081795 RepID=A0A317JQD5_9BACT|nr:MAG: hypothetical protein C5B42_00370 [Candidatus Cerribacteria bacterium 'Amazon FNV 2010 28 9']